MHLNSRSTCPCHTASHTGGLPPLPNTGARSPCPLLIVEVGNLFLGLLDVLLNFTHCLRFRPYSFDLLVPFRYMFTVNDSPLSNIPVGLISRLLSGFSKKHKSKLLSPGTPLVALHKAAAFL